MNSFDQRHVGIVRQLMAWLVAGDFEEVERRTHGMRADMLRLAISEYGMTVIMPPEQAFAAIDAIEVSNATRPTWSVRVDLWTAEQGRSDLTLECTLIEQAEDLLEVEIDNLHVL